MRSIDLIVAAPFEGNGVVYIYFGSPNGIMEKPAQVIKAPSSFPNQMFGYGLSKGVDTDNNGFFDIAIGAPNIEAVYIYKSYPIFFINCSIIPSEPLLSRKNPRFDFQVNCSSETKATQNLTVDINMTIVLDAQFNRAHFTGSNQTVKNKMVNGTLPFNETFNVDYIFDFELIDEPITIGVAYNFPQDFRNRESNENDTTQGEHQLENYRINFVHNFYIIYYLGRFL